MVPIWGVVSLLKAFETEQKVWLEERVGTCRAKIEETIKNGFEAEYMTTSGRWELEKLRQQLAKMEGRREQRAAPAAAPVPMHQG